ncbi:MAG TPA: transglycosylase SLT domain-containing protein, partial [Anaerolineales bacterium]|nr:transglycosylase SLT domain-containing protein [Anaerolineales bacterium]
MREEDYFDYYWEDEFGGPAGGDGGISLYTLPPLAAVVISLLMGYFMIRFAQRQLIDFDASALAVAGAPAAEIQAQPAAPLEPPSAPPAIAAFFSPSVRYWEDRIVEWAAEWDVDPNLAATVMQIESCGHPDVVSSAGATGLFQVMPYHFAAGERATDPDTNAYRGLSYLTRSLEAHDGDVYKALAGYNAGIGGSQRGEANWPAETKRYT